MLFFLKKLISALLLPLPMSLILTAIGLFLLVFTTFRKTGISLTALSFFMLALFSFAPFPNFLLKNLESQYRPLIEAPKDKDVDTIVVLGGGTKTKSNLPPNFQLNAASQARLIEAIRLHRQLPNSTLLLSGGQVFTSVANDSEIMRNTATLLGIAHHQTNIENGSKDTEHEARYLKNKLKDKPFILVTSAAHMPRAMMIFKKEHMNPIPAPTQFLVKHDPYAIEHYVPSAIYLTYSNIAIHEYLGIAFERVKDKSTVHRR